jgi:hypothetical protein
MLMGQNYQTFLYVRTLAGDILAGEKGTQKKSSMVEDLRQELV